MDVQMLTVGPVQENAFLVSQGGHAVLVDPGEEAPKLLRAIESRGLKLDAIRVGPSPPGRSTRPTEPWKRTSPEKIASSPRTE